jgi:repressor LexA
VDISAALRRLRETHDLTQKEVADKLGVTKVAVGQWESGKTIPRRENLQALADFFHVPISELLGEDGTEPVALPHGARRVVGRSGTVPMRRLGKTHAGEPIEEIEGDETVEVPESVAQMHPRGFMLTVEGDCMDRSYPEGCAVLVDPEAEPWSGCAVVAETSPGESVLRRYMRGRSTLMLVADSHSDSYEDMVFSDEDAQEVRTLGVVVWFQADHDEYAKL